VEGEGIIQVNRHFYGRFYILMAVKTQQSTLKMKKACCFETMVNFCHTACVMSCIVSLLHAYIINYRNHTITTHKDIVHP